MTVGQEKWKTWRDVLRLSLKAMDCFLRRNEEEWGGGQCCPFISQPRFILLVRESNPWPFCSHACFSILLCQVLTAPVWGNVHTWTTKSLKNAFFKWLLPPSQKTCGWMAGPTQPITYLDSRLIPQIIGFYSAFWKFDNCPFVFLKSLVYLCICFYYVLWKRQIFSGRNPFLCVPQTFFCIFFPLLYDPIPLSISIHSSPSSSSAVWGGGCFLFIFGGKWQLTRFESETASRERILIRCPLRVCAETWKDF